MQKREPIASVIVPAYNSERYIRSCLESLLAQTCRHIEVIVIDDGSTDTTPEILREYEGDSRVRVIKQDNQGVSAARNNGLRLARGEFVAFVDSDDIVHPQFVETCLKAASDDDCDFVLLSLREFDDDADLSFEPIGSTGSDVVNSPLEYYLDNGFKGAVWLMFVRRRLISGISFPHGISRGEDLYFSFMMLQRFEKGKRIHEPTYFYRRTPGSLDRTDMKMKDVSGIIEIMGELWKSYSHSGKKNASLIQTRLFPMMVKNIVKRAVRRAGAEDVKKMESRIASLVRDKIVRYRGFSLRWRWYLWRICRSAKKDGGA